MISNTTVSLLIAGISTHLTTDYEPKGGYNETHDSIGIQIERSYDNWHFGALGFRFKDSFSEDSGIYAATMRYQIGDSTRYHASAGLGLGYTHTSYYNGVYGAPIVELGYNRLSAQISYIPKMSGTDEVIAAQFKVRVW